MSRSGVRFPSAPPPAFRQTGVHGSASQEWRVSGGQGRRVLHIRGRETRLSANFSRNPPTVSTGGFSDPSFCRCRERARAGLSPESQQPALISHGAGRLASRLSLAAVMSPAWRPSRMASTMSGARSASFNAFPTSPRSTRYRFASSETECILPFLSSSNQLSAWATAAITVQSKSQRVFCNTLRGTPDVPGGRPNRRE